MMPTNESRPALSAEVAGPGPHDGIKFEMPANVDAVLLITKDPTVGVGASLTVRRSSELSLGDIMAALEHTSSDLLAKFGEGA